jgi:glycosyltransferase involved in cell wall biosynthesis
MFFSVIIPVYNRPDEVAELLESLAVQTFKNFEVIIVEDGSTLVCRESVEKFTGRLTVQYFYKPNSGPGDSRNFGALHSAGDCLIFLDSDCIVPQQYLQAIEHSLNESPCDAFGGPDAAHPKFNRMQKAVSYAMTSFLTTGGIRGGKRQMEKFHPRSFNMGVRKNVFQQIGGFSAMRYGEDIDLSIRLFEAGYTLRLFPDAFVYHKRRIDMKKFFWQVYHSGCARIDLYLKHPSSLRAVHFMPAIFTLGCLFLCVASFWKIWFVLPLLAYTVMLLFDACRKNNSLIIGLLSIVTSFTQLFGYGTGFILSFVKKIIFRKVLAAKR